MKKVLLVLLMLLVPVVCFGGAGVWSSVELDSDGMYRKNVIFRPNYRGTIMFTDNATKAHTIKQLGIDGEICDIYGHFWKFAGECDVCDKKIEIKLNGTSGFLNVSELEAFNKRSADNGTIYPPLGDNATSSNITTFDYCMPDYTGGWYYDEKSLDCGTGYTGLFIQTTYIPNALEKKIWGFAGFEWRAN